MELSATITLRTHRGDEILDLEEFEARVERGEIDPSTEVNFPPVTGAAFVRAGELEPFRNLYEPRALYFSRAFHLGRIPGLTILFCLATLGIFWLQLRAGPVDTASMVAFGAKAGPLLHDLGETWRLLTANLVHRDWLHLGFNLFVLFHFGAAVENAYRPLDWLLLLFATALGTTLLSYAMTDAVSAGASGIAYGMLGAAMVFGLKYRRILPEKYRTVLGGALAPTLLVFLYIGFTSSGVDNWGHVGGLLAGALATWPLRPRLLGDAPRGLRAFAGRVLPIAGAIALLVGGSAALAPLLPELELVREEALGLQLPVPRSWSAESKDGAELVYSNGMGAAVRASIAASVRLVEEGYDLEEEAARFLSRELFAAADAGRIRGVAVRPVQYAHVGGLLGVLVEARYADGGVPTRFAAHLFVRGNLLYQLVLVRPEALPAYDRVFERMLAGTAAIEPTFAREARERAGERPRDPGAWIAAGEAAARIGDPVRARIAFDRAHALSPEDPLPLAALAKIAFGEGLVREGCKLAAQARALDPERAVVLEALSRCALERGDGEAALAKLEEAAARAPDDALLRRRLERLRRAPLRFP